MLIESIIRRPQGSNVLLGTTLYHFKPLDGGTEHVAEVTNEEHIKKLLSITDGYREFSEPDTAPPKKVSGLSGSAGAGRGKRLSAKEQTLRSDAEKAYVDKFGSEPEAEMSTDEILSAVEAEGPPQE